MEVADYLESHIRVEQAGLKQDLSQKHFLARDIAQYVSLMFAEKKDCEPPELWDYFPDLFAAEKTEIEKGKQAKQLEVYKAQMQDFAYRHNQLGRR